MSDLVAPASPPLDFSLPSTASQTIDLQRYRDKVPVVLVFLGDLESAAPIVATLDAELIDFGHRRIQLLVIATGSIAHANGLRPDEGTVPVLADGDGAVTASFDAVGSGDDAHVIVIGLTGSIIARTVVDRRNPAAAILAFADLQLGMSADARIETERDPNSNSPIVIDGAGSEVNVEERDPMPGTLRTLEDIHESDLSGDAMGGEAPTG